MSNNPIKVLLKSHPQRSIALCTPEYVLIFRHLPSSSHATAPTYSSHLPHNAYGSGPHAGSSSSSLPLGSGSGASIPKCMVEFRGNDSDDMKSYHPMGSALPCRGTLGLIDLNGDIFLCVVTGASQVATVRPGETVFRIHAVEFHCLNTSEYDNMSLEETYPSHDFDYGHKHGEGVFEHPCAALRKMISEGTFYYSVDFDLTNRLQDRSADHTTVSTNFSIESFNDAFLWNIALIKPLLLFRSRLPNSARDLLDSTRILTSVIRGFVETVTVPRGIVRQGTSAASHGDTTVTIISRLSCKRAGTRFNSRGMDDDGHVANFVETETIVWDSRGERNSRGVAFSYTQVRGSVPVFWEQSAGLLPGQQKILITRGPEATLPSFEKHMEGMNLKYGTTHIVNLLSATKPGEAELTKMFKLMVKQAATSSGPGRDNSELIRETEYDFHEETRGGYEAAAGIRRYIDSSADAFAYFLTEDVDHDDDSTTAPKSNVVIQQEGVFRTNCLDCLDRTNLVQQIISQMAMEKFLAHSNERAQGELWYKHQILWADNGDALSRIYAGTGALKSSFTRTGKTSLSGALADIRKSATRMYINNFADKGRQNTIDMLLGRLVGQEDVILFDPINDYVNSELAKKSAQYSSSKVIRIHVGTFNLNGRMEGIYDDLTPWVFPSPCPEQPPEIVVIGFQEIVELSPQQIMSTDPARRQDWEKAVLKSLNKAIRQSHHEHEYIMLRGGQLVGAALAIYVRSDVISNIKNVEGSLKKTGMSGLSGNKGAVAIRFEYANTRMCLVTAHLAAGFANYDERNRDYRTISTGLRFQRGRTIDDHDVVIWLGDFNYRIGLANEEVRRHLEVGDLATLYDNDQLQLQMVAGLTFPYYSEAKLTFMPTYKYDLGLDRYDTSEKSRIPAWTDRILRKGSNLRQLTYNTASLKFSDHRPVYATFEAVISIINEEVKAALAKDIYLHRRDEVGGKTAAGSDDAESDDDLIDFEPIAPGLPPASSDSRKWWLDNGVSAKSQVKPPGDAYDLNPDRPINPFSYGEQKDWVKRGAPLPPPARNGSVKIANNEKSPLVLSDAKPQSTINQTTTHTPISRDNSLRGRRLPPPYDPASLPSLGNQILIPHGKSNGLIEPMQPMRLNTSATGGNDTSTRARQLPPQPRPKSAVLTRSISSSSNTSKTAPPVPRKPAKLSRSGTTSPSPSLPNSAPQIVNKPHKETLSSSNDVASNPSITHKQLPILPPPPRKVATSDSVNTNPNRGTTGAGRTFSSYGAKKQVDLLSDDLEDDGSPPPLPPRTNTGSLI